MTALAVYFKQRGDQVLGSDVNDSYPTETILSKYNIQVVTGFFRQNVPTDADLVVVTGAHGGLTNPEAVRATELKIKTLSLGEAVGEVMRGKENICVAGCHGKTTTSALLACLFTQAGYKPSYLVGSTINDLGTGGHYDRGKYFIAEADEYFSCPLTQRKPRFLWQNPNSLVITNIEYDHPDAFADIEAVKNAFRQFVNKLPTSGLLVAGRDSSHVVSILPQISSAIITYGLSAKADYWISRYYFEEGVSFMRINHKNLEIGEFMLKIPGIHNLLNALAAAIVAFTYGISWTKLKKFLVHFSGTKRRFEYKGTYQKTIFYDDYAHHPTEIEATLSALRNWYPSKKVLVIFQPHTFSRTKALLVDFAGSFIQADQVIVTDIFPSAREEKDETISSVQLVIASNKFKNNAIYKSNKKEVASFLNRNLNNFDIVMTMGAGDIWKYGEAFLSQFKGTK